MATRVVIKIHVLTADAGECPMCGFDSLRKVSGYHLTSNGVTTMFEQTYCGRCINDMRESL